MIIRILFLKALLLLGFVAQAEIYSLKRSPALDFLYSYKGSISDIGFFPYYYDDAFMFRAPKTNLPLPIKFFKNEQGLYLLANGCGYVYKAQGQSADSLRFVRLDSTIYYGYNVSALKFCYNNTFYSLGGYGFWRYNGYLLQFNPGNDWQPVNQLNYEVRGLNYPYSLSPETGKLYLLSSSFTDDITKEQVLGNAMYELDLPTTQFKKLGSLNEAYLEQFSKRSGLTHPLLINFPSLQGSLVRFSTDLHLISFATNKVYRLNNKSLLSYLNLHFLNTPNKGFVFAIGDRLFFNNREDGPLLSIRLTFNDFELLTKPLYNRQLAGQGVDAKSWLLLLSFFLVGCIVFMAYRQRQLIRQLSDAAIEENGNVSENQSIGRDPIPFSNFEELFIQKLMEREGYFSVEEINEILGVKKKSVEFQKKIRTEAISRINLKFKSVSNAKEDLIERLRTPEDKRFMQYRIPEHLKPVWRRLAE